MFQFLFMLAIIGVIVAGVWKAFEKAGKPGWAAIVPIYNLIVMLEIAGRPLWWIVLFFIPIINLIAAVIVSIDIAKAYGQGPGFGVGLALLGFVFWPILGFGDARYMGPSPQPIGFEPIMPQRTGSSSTGA